MKCGFWAEVHGESEGEPVLLWKVVWGKEGSGSIRGAPSGPGLKEWDEVEIWSRAILIWFFGEKKKRREREREKINQCSCDFEWEKICEEHLLVLVLVLLLPFITFHNSSGICLVFISYLTWHKYLSILQEGIYLFHWYLDFLLLSASGLCCIISGQRPMYILHSHGSPSLWATSVNYHHSIV